MLAAAGLFAVSTLVSTAAVQISTSFATDPAQQGWKTYGESSLFQWNSKSGALDVTWDSSKTNSYFYHPLGTVISRSDDFSVEFDLTLNDILGSFEVTLGFMNMADATNPAFFRGTGSASPNLVEFDYFPAGEFWDGGVSPTFSATNRWEETYNSSITSGWLAYTLPFNSPLHVTFAYTGSNSTVFTTVSNNGTALVSGPYKIETKFTDFRCDTFAIESYNDTGAWGSTVLAHGSVSNLKITVPTPPLANIKGQMRDGAWTVSFDTATNWNYLLESSEDLKTWSAVSDAVSGTGTRRSVPDASAGTNARFYRVSAQKPN